MVEDGRDPERTVVTVVAVFAGYYVAGRFASCTVAVVTGATTAGNRRVVHIENRTPGRCGMAAIAGFRRRNMARGLYRGQHGADLRVTANTGWIRALKDTAGVTTVAGDILMRAIQLKPRREVVERLLAAGGGTPQQGT